MAHTVQDHPRMKPNWPLDPSGKAVGYRVGDYEIDLGCFQLRHRGARRPVQPRVFDLLVFLVRHRDRVVSAAELRATVWEGVCVCPDALTYSVKAARRALGDDGKAQATIENVRGRGYRFIAPVEELVRSAPYQEPPPHEICARCGSKLGLRDAGFGPGPSLSSPLTMR